MNIEPTKEEVVDFIHWRLKQDYPERYHHFNKSRLFDEVLFIFLTWRTPIDLAHSIFEQIYLDISDRNLFFTWSEHKWFQLLISGGKAQDKARTLVKMLIQIEARYKNIENFEQQLSILDDQLLFKELTALPGVKAKSAYCTMLYALKRSVFPADAHCIRIASRMGLVDVDIKKKQERERAQNELQWLIGGDYTRCYDTHTKMIVHGQQVCKPKPLCSICGLYKWCEYYAENRALINEQ